MNKIKANHLIILLSFLCIILAKSIECPPGKTFNSINSICEISEIIHNYELNDTIVCPNNCTTCNNETCTICSKEYCLYQNYCYESCPHGFFCLDGKCQDSNYLDNDTILYCKENHYLWQNSCIDSCPYGYYGIN